jgi:hypothetical protein
MHLYCSPVICQVCEVLQVTDESIWKVFKRYCFGDIENGHVQRFNSSQFYTPTQLNATCPTFPNTIHQAVPTQPDEAPPVMFRNQIADSKLICPAKHSLSPISEQPFSTSQGILSRARDHWKVSGSADPSATASLCFSVFAFLLMPFFRFEDGPSATGTGVAAPDGLAELSSKLPSPEVPTR